MLWSFLTGIPKHNDWNLAYKNISVMKYKSFGIIDSMGFIKICILVFSNVSGEKTTKTL